MKYISTVTWRDNTDGHLYREGEPFPFDGREIPKERLDSLESGHNRAGLRLIKELRTADDRKDVETAAAPKTAAEGQETVPAKKEKNEAGEPAEKKTAKPRRRAAAK